MLLKNKLVQLCIAIGLGILVMLLPRPEGKLFEVVGDPEEKILSQVGENFSKVVLEGQKSEGYVLQAIAPGTPQATASHLFIWPLRWKK